MFEKCVPSLCLPMCTQTQLNGFINCITLLKCAFCFSLSSACDSVVDPTYAFFTVRGNKIKPTACPCIGISDRMSSLIKSVPVCSNKLPHAYPLS